MNEEEYIKQRLDDQASWYSKKSGENQNWHKRLQVLQIMSAASIPFLASFITDESSVLKIITGVLGVMVAVITGVTALYKFEEKWIKYRTTAESLKHEKYLYLTLTEPYDGEEPFKLLVQRVESLISQENREWGQFAKKGKQLEKD